MYSILIAHLLGTWVTMAKEFFFFFAELQRWRGQYHCQCLQLFTCFFYFFYTVYTQPHWLPTVSQSMPPWKCKLHNVMMVVCWKIIKIKSILHVGFYHIKCIDVRSQAHLRSLNPFFPPRCPCTQLKMTDKPRCDTTTFIFYIYMKSTQLVWSIQIRSSYFYRTYFSYSILFFFSYNWANSWSSR